MERKDYLIEKLTKEENKYIKTLVTNVKRKYIRNNYAYLNNSNIDLYDCVNLEGDSVLETVINKCEEEIKSAIEFEKIICDEKLYKIVKALSLREKMVLFSLYKENKSINQIAVEMKLERTTVWRIKNKALDRIMKKMLGGNKNV